MDVFPKFIIEDDSLILGKVSYHKNLANDPSKVKGGGWFRLENNTFIFYGDSHDFGRADIEDIKKCIKEGNVYTNKFKTHNISNEYNFAYNTGCEIINLME